MSDPLLIPDLDALREQIARALLVNRGYDPDCLGPSMAWLFDECLAEADVVLAVLRDGGTPAVAEHLERVDVAVSGTGRYTRRHRYVTDWQLP